MILALILTLTLAIVQYASAVCNVCNDNGVACISGQEFNLCENGQPNTLRTLNCSGQKICTTLPAICVEPTEASVVPGCGDISNCGICDGTESDGNYACTSRTTYTMCLGGNLTDVRGTCPENRLCDISLGQTGQNPCVPNCREPNIQFCDRIQAIDQPIVTTETPDTTTDTVLPEISTTQVSEAATVLPTTTMTTTTNNSTAALTTTTVIFSPTPPGTTTGNETTTTGLPTATQSPAAVLCSQQTASGRHPLPNDSTCRNYVFCFKKNGGMQATVLTCPNNFYFNATTKLCGLARPQGCI